MTCQPDYLIMGMSSETFWGGVAGNAQFIERVRAQSGLTVSTGASACRAALEVYGVKRIAVLSPYQAIADKQVTGFFEESGFKVVRFKGLRCPTATSIAEVTEAPLRKILGEELNGPDAEAIVQVGRTCRWSASPTRLSAGSASQCWPSTPSPSGTRCGPTASRTSCGASVRSCESIER